MICAHYSHDLPFGCERDHDCSVCSTFLTLILMVFPKKKFVIEPYGQPSPATPKVSFTFKEKKTPFMV